jgi:misacylated tRNA(Ala) deacylase
MTDLLYQTDSYLREFPATVVAVNTAEGAVALDRTAFYPGGGGQPHDLGVLRVDNAALPVTRVRQQGGQVWHWLNGALPAVGTSVVGALDWDRRYSLMRTHTALHILCGVVWRDYGALVTGGNMEPLQGRMDFEFETLRRELVQEIEARVNAEVQQGREVCINILPREAAFQIPDLIRTKINLLPEGIAQVRTVEIVGLDLQADGGTHVANTREVRHVRVVDYKSKGQINKRIHIALDV